MRLPRALAIVFIGAALLPVLPMAVQADEKISWYRSHLGPDCHFGTYSQSKEGVVRDLKRLAGAYEEGFAAALMHSRGLYEFRPRPRETRLERVLRKRRNRIASYFVAMDAIGRVFGGKCAGMTGLDDFILKPLYDGAEAIYDRSMGASSKGDPAVESAPDRARAHSASSVPSPDG